MVLIVVQCQFHVSGISGAKHLPYLSRAGDGGHARSTSAANHKVLHVLSPVIGNEDMEHKYIQESSVTIGDKMNTRIKLLDYYNHSQKATDDHGQDKKTE